MGEKGVVGMGRRKARRTTGEWTMVSAKGGEWSKRFSEREIPGGSRR
jgi:hypothetical protein